MLADLDTLATLPERELRAGLAEVIKYGVIADAALFRRLERDLDRLLARDPAALAATIARCCEIKAAVVTEDETEAGRRAILNFGHTIGHAIEAVTGYGELLHGEAISLGQVAAAWLSERLAGLPAADVGRIRRLLERVGLPVARRFSVAERARLLDAMRLDKKVSGGEVLFVLAPRLGHTVWKQRVSAELLDGALDAVAEQAERREVRARKHALD